MSIKKPITLIILDGWGLRFAHRGNAVIQARTPNFNRWLREVESSILDASGEAVGLVENQMGNSEVGHLNLGAGRVVKQDISRIDDAIESEKFDDLVLSSLNIKQGQKLHLVGLLGPGGVHAHDRHLYATLQAVNRIDGLHIVIHVITDGRDTPPKSCQAYLESLLSFIEKEQINATIATVSGRYYAMDRDNRWDRTLKAYEAMVERKGKHASSPISAVQRSYDEGITDEFIIPTVIDSDEECAVENGDSIFFYNFRADRMRQIVKMFSPEKYDEIPNHKNVSDLNLLTMTTYEKDFQVDVLFPMEIVKHTLSEFLSENNFSQLHIAETEKYPHVTYFFNGRREVSFNNEERIIVPSPKVATYDLEPEMSAYEVTKVILERLQSDEDNFILVNYANPDMVGHTGDLDAVIKAVETVDECVGNLVEAIIDKEGTAVIIADHGNAELMIDPLSDEPHTYHTTNPVPFLIIGKDKQYAVYPRGILADVAPTIIDLFGLQPPSEMTGKSLIKDVR